MIFIVQHLSLLCIAIFIIYSAGKVFELLCFWQNPKQNKFSFFKVLFYGIILVVYFYSGFKSELFFNSVTLTLAPLLMFVFEKKSSLEPSIFNDSLDNLSSKKLNFFSILFFLIFWVFKYLFHFSSVVNTGYGDQCWYHLLAMNLKNTGVESMNIHIDPINQKAGFVYHYWDIWLQAFSYETLDFFNSINIFNGVNYFEVYVVVCQPLLFFILLIGLAELAATLVKLNKYNIHIFVLVAIVFLSLTHVINEFGIIFHSKQFIVAATFIFILINILNGNKNYFSFYLFLIPLLFYYPLPGAVLIATIFIFQIFEYRDRLKDEFTKYLLLFLWGGISITVFVWYYFLYGVTCYKAELVEKWEVKKAVWYVLVYNGYHTLFSLTGLITIIGFLLLINPSFINKKLKFVLSGQTRTIIMISILNIVVGKIISGILYNAPETFQFYNNTYFNVSILLIVILFFLLHMVNKWPVVYKSGLYLFFIYLGYINSVGTFLNENLFYNSIKIAKSDYMKIKEFKDSAENIYPVSNSSSLYSINDIITSFFNKSIRHQYNICSQVDYSEPIQSNQRRVIMDCNSNSVNKELNVEKIGYTNLGEKCFLYIESAYKE